MKVIKNVSQNSTTARGRLVQKLLNKSMKIIYGKMKKKKF